MLVERATVADIYGHAGFDDVVTEYAEYRIKRLPAPRFNQSDYEALEKHGIHAAFKAVKGGSLIGFLSILDTRIPHYGINLAVVESLYVLKAHRKTGAGLRLIRMAEEYARGKGNYGIFINCPYGAELAQVLPRLDYTPETITYFKPL